MSVRNFLRRFTSRTALRWFIVLVAVAGCFGLLFRSKPFQQCISHTNYSSAAEDSKEYILRVPPLIDLGVDCAWAVTATFTIVLAISTILLWSSTRELAKATQQVATISQSALTDLERAYLFVVDFQSDIGRFFDPSVIRLQPRRPYIDIIAINHGRTPCTIVQGSSRDISGRCVPSQREQSQGYNQDG